MKLTLCEFDEINHHSDSALQKHHGAKSETAKLTIILPTFNERGNIDRVLQRLDEVMRRVDYPYQIVVVDDDSPDGTWKRARELTDEYPMFVIRRIGERGLATAVVRGIKTTSSEYILVLDADLQHPPEKVPDLVTQLEGGKDIVIGSRFVDGGSSGEFTVFRHLMTYGANILAKALFWRLWGIKDLQSGFFAVRRPVIDGTDLRPQGYKILIEILVRGDYEDIIEIGYRFREREVGDSNIGLDTIVAYLYHIIYLKLESIT